MPKTSELPVLPFESKMKFVDWLAKNHDRSAVVKTFSAKFGNIQMYTSNPADFLIFERPS